MSFDTKTTATLLLLYFDHQVQLAIKDSSYNLIENKSSMNVDYEVKVEHDIGDVQQTIPLNVINDTSVPASAPIVEQCKNKGNKKKMPSEDETLNTLRLLGEPLVAHGPYTFYRALAYRKHDKTKSKKRLLKKQQTQESINENTYTAGSVDLSCGGYENDNFYSCKTNSSLSHSEWSVVRMNHFYNVRPWYSKNNSSIGKHFSNLNLTSSTSTVAEQRLHHQQSVCIGELELLWRDDSIATETSLAKNSSRNQADGCDSSNANINKNHNNVNMDSSDGNGNYNNNATDLQRRRTLPRRTRQPSTKKLEAAESYAAVAAAAIYENHPLKQMTQHRIQLLSDQPDNTSNTQYTHGNLLCSVRLYVMPDQTSVGRLSGVHGEDEVLEINTWNINNSRDGSPSNTFISSIYDGGDRMNDYRNHYFKTLPSGCSGLVLRAEDFVEWVRGGLMDYEDGNLHTDVKSSELECNNGFNCKQHSKISPLIKNIKDEFNTFNDNENKKIKLCMMNEEKLNDENLENLNGNNVLTEIINSDIEKVLESERVPLAAAKIHQHYHFNCDNDTNINTKVNKMENNGQICYCYCCKCNYSNNQDNNKKRKTHVCDSNIKQQLVVMSYSRYCRYRSQLQRRYDKQKIEMDSTAFIDNNTIASTYQENSNKTRVLFCRDTYDYPAELLLEPFNIHQSHNQNSTVLVNHMAPKLKGWPAHPASWMSFRWNKVCRRQCRKIKKKCLRQNRTNGTTTTGYSTTEDDDSDSDENSLATNTTITASDCESSLPPASIVDNINSKKFSPNVKKVNGGVNNKKNHTTATANNIITINGDIPDVTVEQFNEQQPNKRRRIIYSTENKSKQSNDQLNEPQHNQHMVIIQQHKLQSLNKLSTHPITSIQSSNTRVIHHHLPPSVTIRPVNPTISISPHQSEHNLNTILQKKQSTISAVSYVASQYKNNPQKKSEKKIEYDDNLEYTSDDNCYYNKSTLVTEVMTCRKRVECKNVEDGQKKLQADEEKQCRWLGDALRLNGLEVTAVPLKTGSKINEKNYDTGFHQQQLHTPDVQIESLLSTNNKRHDSNDNLNIEKESVMMTVTPDIVCILNKSLQQQQAQKPFQKKPLDTKSVTVTKHQQHRSSKNMNNHNSNSSSGQSYKQVSAISLDTAEALQLKINHSIKQPQQQKLKKNNTTSVRNNNMLVTNETNCFHVNTDNASKQNHKVQNINEFGVHHQTSLDLSVKPLKQQKQLSLLPAINSNLQLYQLKKGKALFHSTPKSSAAATNLEITIVPVTTSTSTTKITQQKLHGHNLFTTAHNNSFNVFNIMSSPSAPKIVRKQIQQNNSPVVISTSASVIDMSCVNGNQEKHVQHSLSIIKTSTDTSTNSTRPQQKFDKFKHTK